MCKHGGTPSWRDEHVTPAAISPPGVARGRFVGGQQSGLAGCKPPPLFTRGAYSCSSQGRRQGEPRGTSPGPSAPTYLPSNARILASQTRILDVTSSICMPGADVLVDVDFGFCITIFLIILEIMVSMSLVMNTVS